MADNTDLSAAVGSGDKVVTREISHGGDTAKLQGVFAMGISGNEGSYTAAAIGGDAANGLDVDVTRVGGTVTVANAGTFAVQVDGSALTALQLIDDPVATLGTTTYTETTTKGMIVGAVRRDADTTLVDTTNEVGPLQMDANGRLKVEAFSGETLPVSLASVPSHAVTNAGTFAVQVDGSALTSLQLIDDTVFAEDVAAQAADKGIAVLAVRRDADTSLVGTDNDYANLQVNASGSLKVAITSGAGSGGTSIADGASFTRDTTSVTLAAAAVESSAPTLTNGDAAALSMTTGGALRVSVASGGIAGVVEDAAAAGGEEGVMVLAVRRDVASSGVGTDGDFATLSVTSDGSLRVSGGGGGTEYVVDAVAPAAPTGATFVMERDDALSALTEVEGDWTNPRASANGALWVSVDGTVTVGSHAVTNAGTFAVQATLAAGATTIAKAEDAVHSSGDVGVYCLAVRSDTAASTATTDGDYTSLITDSTGKLHVNVGNTVTVGSHAVTNAGTFAVQSAAAGVAADDAATSGNPVLIGGVAVETDGTDPTTVSAEGDAAYLRTDRARLLLVNQTHPRCFSASADYASAQTNTSVKAAPGAGLKLYITDIEFSNGATAGNVTLLDGSGGTVLWEIYPAINGGAVTNRRNPIVLTANTALCITSTTVTTHSINIGGYIAP